MSGGECLVANLDLDGWTPSIQTRLLSCCFFQLFCVTLNKYNKNFEGVPPEQIASWIHEQTLWDNLKKRPFRPLTLSFLNICPEGTGKALRDIILDVNSAWKIFGQGCFEYSPGDTMADIRVEFHGKFTLVSMYKYSYPASSSPEQIQTTTAVPAS